MLNLLACDAACMGFFKRLCAGRGVREKGGKAKVRRRTRDRSTGRRPSRISCSDGGRERGPRTHSDLCPGQRGTSQSQRQRVGEPWTATGDDDDDDGSPCRIYAGRNWEWITLPMPPLARASYKKSGGVLELTESELKWTPDGGPTPALVVPHSRATCSYTHHTPSNLAYPSPSPLLQQGWRAPCPSQAWPHR